MQDEAETIFYSKMELIEAQKSQLMLICLLLVVLLNSLTSQTEGQQ